MPLTPAHILTGDCLALLPRFPVNSVDLILSDLPYGQTQNPWDRVIPIDAMWREVRRVAKRNAAIIFMAAQPFASDLIVSNRDEFRYDLIWQKNKPTGFLNANRQPLRIHEHILVFYRAAPVYHPQKTQGHEPGHKAQRAKKSSNYGAYESTGYGGSTERHPTSIVPIPIINNDSPDKFHPTQKPVDLMSHLIRSYSDEGALVLDIAAGVGTTAVAASLCGRRSIAIELNHDYVAIAKRRLETS